MSKSAGSSATWPAGTVTRLERSRSTSSTAGTSSRPEPWWEVMCPVHVQWAVFDARHKIVRVCLGCAREAASWPPIPDYPTCTTAPDA